jgi:hypothetical protein
LQNLDGLVIFLEIFSLGKFLWEAELVEPEALVADFWDQDGLVASLEVSGSIWTDEELCSALTVDDVGPEGGQ